MDGRDKEGVEVVTDDEEEEYDDEYGSEENGEGITLNLINSIIFS